MNLGEFEQLVLLACIRLEGTAYAVAILEELESRGRRTSHAAVYIALRRLEARGLTVSEPGAPAPDRGGRPRLIYRVLPEARRMLAEYRDTYMSMWEGLEPAGGAR